MRNRTSRVRCVSADRRAGAAQTPPHRRRHAARAAAVLGVQRPGLRPALATGEARQEERAHAARRRGAGSGHPRAAGPGDCSSSAAARMPGSRPGQRYFVRARHPRDHDHRADTARRRSTRRDGCRFSASIRSVATADGRARVRRHPVRRLPRAVRRADDRGAAASRHDAPVRQHGTHRDRRRRAPHRRRRAT